MSCSRILSVAAIASFSLIALTPRGMLAQSQPQTGTPATTQQNRPSSAEPITIVGCVQREADYRKAKDAGRGGVAGTGIGAGNEFVLTNASMTTGGAAAAAVGAGTAAEKPTATTGAGGSGSAYELTGPNEEQLATHVNKRVEITGMLKAAEVGASGAPTGGPTAGTPPRGVDVISKDLKLREVEVSSVKEMAGNCPAAP